MNALIYALLGVAAICCLVSLAYLLRAEYHIAQAQKHRERARFYRFMAKVLGRDDAGRAGK